MYQKKETDGSILLEQAVTALPGPEHTCVSVSPNLPVPEIRCQLRSIRVTGPDVNHVLDLVTHVAGRGGAVGRNASGRRGGGVQGRYRGLRRGGDGRGQGADEAAKCSSE